MPDPHATGSRAAECPRCGKDVESLEQHPLFADRDDLIDGNVTPAWQHSTEWQAWRADNYTAAGPELNDAGRVAVAADRAHLATQIEAMSSDAIAVDRSAAYCLGAVLALLRDTP